MTQVEILDRKRDTSQPYILDLLDKLAARQLLPVIEVTLVAVFVLVIAVDAHRKKTVRLAQSASPAPKVQIAGRTAAEQPLSSTPASPVSSPAATETGAPSAAPPRASQGVVAGLNPILPPEIYHAGNPPTETAAAASPATQESAASPAAPDFQPRVPLPLDRPEGQAANAAPAPGNLAGSFAPIIPPGLYRPPAGAPPAQERGQAQAPTEAPAAPTAAKEAVTTAPAQEAARVADPASPPPPAATAGLASSLAPILPPGLYSASAGAPAAQEAARTAGEVPATPPAASSPPPAEPTTETARAAEPTSPPSPTAAAGLASSLAPILPPGLYNASSGAPATPETPAAPTTPPPPAGSAAVAAPPSPPPSAASADLANSIAPIMPPAVYRAATDAPNAQTTTPVAPKPETTVAPAPAETDAAVKSEAEAEAAPGAAVTVPAAPIVEARLRPEDTQKAALPDKQAEQKDFADAFQTASRMLERRLTPEERAASMAPDYVDAIQRIEGFYDPTRVGPFGGGLRMGIRPGTMSMTDVFGERWTRAYPDPNVHYRVGYHAETWLRPLSHKCEDFWRFRTDDSPVALDKLTPADCARIRAKTPSDTKLMADSSVVAAPLSVPAFAAPYPGSRMTHDELMSALRARATAAREKLWLSRTPGLVRPIPAKPKPALSSDTETQTN